jgi:hypothetical protein
MAAAASALPLERYTGFRLRDCQHDNFTAAACLLCAVVQVIYIGAKCSEQL